MCSTIEDVPGDLEQRCIAISKKPLKNKSGATSESIGTWSRSYNAEKANAFIESTTEMYRRF